MKKSDTNNGVGMYAKKTLFLVEDFVIGLFKTNNRHFIYLMSILIFAIVKFWSF